MNDLDQGLINRAAPPGSMRYFSLLYTPAEKRDVLAALYVVDAEIHTSATQVSHDVAHTRLQWWRAEIDRLINHNAQHPATKVLQSAAQIPFATLHERMVAADMDLTRMTYNTARELSVYLDRSGGVIGELMARYLFGPIELGAATLQIARQVFCTIRRVETLRDLASEARTGRIYWPLDELERTNIPVDELQSASQSAPLKQLIATTTAQLRSQLTDAMQPLPRIEREILRPLAVLGALHTQLLKTITAANYDVASARREVGPFNKAWTAWRAARRN